MGYDIHDEDIYTLWTKSWNEDQDEINLNQSSNLEEEVDSRSAKSNFMARSLLKTLYDRMNETGLSAADEAGSTSRESTHPGHGPSLRDLSSLRFLTFQLDFSDYYKLEINKDV